MRENFENVLDELSVNLSLKLEYKGKVVLDEKLAKLLYLINKKGSILSASKSLGIPYSRAWEWISKVERLLGIEVVSRRRGGLRGGGTLLTREGKRLLDFYLEKAKQYGVNFISDSQVLHKTISADLVFAGSHDPVMEVIFNEFSKETGFNIDVSWVGSTAGFLAIMLREVDVAGCHLLDPSSGEYNVPYLERYWMLEDVIIVRGFMREISLIFNPTIELNTIEDIIDKGIRIVNRNPGSGTRILLDKLIENVSKERNVDRSELVKKVKGYNFEVKTHYDVAKAILNGKADAGLALTNIAKKFGLNYKPIKWELYDLLIPVEVAEKKSVKELLIFLRSEKARRIIDRQVGYKAINETGRIIYKPEHLRLRI